MKLVIDLSKAGTLNTAKLVKKPVRVRGQDGKVYTRMQWVKPGEVPGVKTSGKGKEEEEKTPRARIDTTRDPKKEKEVEDNTKKVLEEAYKLEQETQKIQSDLKHYIDPISIDSEVTVKEFMQVNEVHPEISNFAKYSVKRLGIDDPNADLHFIGANVEGDWSMISKHIEDKINSSTGDNLAKRIQINALKEGNTTHELSVAAHPVLARKAVDTILGVELANKFRDDLKDANLSINFHGSNSEEIEKEGYIASTMESYIEKTMGEEGLAQLEKVLGKDFVDERARIEHLKTLRGNDWMDVYDRAKAEYKAVGIYMEDRKPTYIAFNPINNPTGAATYYGNSWMKVDPSVLEKCTLTFDDSFMDTRSIPKVWDMEHLKDAFILKCLEINRDIKDIRSQGDDWDGLPWYHDMGEIPLELQYHEPSIPPDLLKIQRPEDMYVSDDDLDDLDDIGEYKLSDGDLDSLDDLGDFEIEDENYK